MESYTLFNPTNSNAIHFTVEEDYISVFSSIDDELSDSIHMSKPDARVLYKSAINHDYELLDLDDEE